MSGVSIGDPRILLTDKEGPNQRLRVDAAQTSFFAGREFRTFLELNIATSAVVVIKAVVPVNIILNKLETVIDDGFLKIETVVGGTEGGVFTALSTFPANTMTEVPSPAPTAQVVLTTGGTHTGGTVLDIIRLRAAVATAQQSSVGSSAFDERGVVANTYYFRLTNLGGTVTGTFKARWEERP